jgi:FKBP-type peptidyl-prolyl cis-trans isomerase SlyD
MKITDSSVVKLEWSLKIDGKIVERSLEGEPATILMGYAKGLPVGLEGLLIGHDAGTEFEAKLENAYGEYDPSKIHTAKTSDFPASTDLQLGTSFYTQDEHGKPLVARVVKLEQDVVTVDFNHERAGKILEYQIKILNVRPSDPSELEHGHVHGEGGIRHEGHA